VVDPIGDAERTELGEITVIENQNEMSRLVAKTFEHMRVATGKIPDIPRRKIVRFGLAGRIDDCRAYTSSDDKGPLRCGRVPVKLAHYARLKLHRHARDSFRDRQLLNRRFFPETVLPNFALGFLQFEFETGQSLSGKQRVRHVILKT